MELNGSKYNPNVLSTLINIAEVCMQLKDYEESLFGEVFTDFSSPEAIVNMYVYIIGEEIVWDYINQLEVA